MMPGAVTMSGTKTEAFGLPAKCCKILGTAGASDTMAMIGKKAATAMTTPWAAPAERRAPFFECSRWFISIDTSEIGQAKKKRPP